MLEQFIPLRRLASILAVFWSLQIIVCIEPPTYAAASGQEAAHASSRSHQHHRASSANGRSDREAADHSQPAAPDHHHGADGSCAQHCASLSQTLTASPAALPLPTVAPVAVVPLAAQSDVRCALASAVARLELERPPPDLLARHSTLRI